MGRLFRRDVSKSTLLRDATGQWVEWIYNTPRCAMRVVYIQRFSIQYTIQERLTKITFDCRRRVNCKEFATNPTFPHVGLESVRISLELTCSCLSLLYMWVTTST